MTENSHPSPPTAIIAGVKAAIAERQKRDPLAAPLITATQLRNHLAVLLHNGKGVHAGSLLCALGALAGYACQVGARLSAAKKGDHAPFMVVECRDGSTYYTIR